MIVCFGGGKGLSATARALQLKDAEFAAVVSTLDNGGSTGRLRREFGVPAMGDFRRVVDYLSESPLARVMEGRHGGHALGNLAILELIREHGFVEGLELYRRAMGVRREIVPLYTEPAELGAIVDGRKILGEEQVDASRGRVERLFAEPEPPVNPRVLELVEEADLLVFGPGSLYTSVLVHFTSRELVRAVRGRRVAFVVGIENDLPIVEGYTLSDHVAAFERFARPSHIVVNSRGRIEMDMDDERLVLGELSTDGRHDPEKLGDVLWELR